jgi:hypothetical protein
MSHRRLFTLVAFLILALLVAQVSNLSAHPAPVPAAILATAPRDSVAAILRGYMLKALPDPLHERKPNWGHQKKSRNQGSWRRTRITAINPADTLVLGISNVQSPEPGRLTFTVALALDARAEYQRQLWEAGVKVFDTTARARFRIKARLDCEATTRLEANFFLMPEAVVRLAITKSDVQFDNIVVEHIAGVGGDAAKVLGDAVIKSIHQLHPSLERRLLDKANAAVVKAGATKEVRLGLLQLWKKDTGKAKTE